MEGPGEKGKLVENDSFFICDGPTRIIHCLWGIVYFDAFSNQDNLHHLNYSPVLLPPFTLLYIKPQNFLLLSNHSIAGFEQTSAYPLSRSSSWW